MDSCILLSFLCHLSNLNIITMAEFHQGEKMTASRESDLTGQLSTHAQLSFSELLLCDKTCTRNFICIILFKANDYSMNGSGIILILEWENWGLWNLVMFAQDHLAGNAEVGRCGGGEKIDTPSYTVWIHSHLHPVNRTIGSYRKCLLYFVPRNKA